MLLVDDIATKRLVAATSLRLFGARVIEAESGETALRLQDTNTPGMDGLEMLQRLWRHEDGRGRVPVIAITADATEGHRRGCLAAGLDGYGAKPLSPDRLADALRPHLALVPAGVTGPRARHRSEVG